MYWNWVKMYQSAPILKPLLLISLVEQSIHLQLCFLYLPSLAFFLPSLVSPSGHRGAKRKLSASTAWIEWLQARTYASSGQTQRSLGWDQASQVSLLFLLYQGGLKLLSGSSLKIRLRLQVAHFLHLCYLHPGSPSLRHKPVPETRLARQPDSPPPEMLWTPDDLCLTWSFSQLTLVHEKKIISHLFCANLSEIVALRICAHADQ